MIFSADPVAVMIETTLVPRLQTGDPVAYEELVRCNASRLLRVARRMLDSEEDARDAVQDAFVAAFRSIADFESAALVSTWLHRILVNACLMQIRKRSRKPEEDLEDAAEVAAPWCESAEAILQRTEMCSVVRYAIEQLPETYRVVLLLRDIEERSTEEAATILGTTPNAVKIRLHRARQALRTLLDPYMRAGVQ